MSDRRSIALLSHLASPRTPTGAEHSLALLARGLASRGHRVAVTAPGPWALAEPLRSAGVEVHTIRTRACWLTYWDVRPWPVGLYKWLRCALPQPGTAGLRRFIERFGADVVHVNCLPHLAGARAARAAGRPVVWHLREILPAGARRRWLAARLRHDADRIVAVSEAVACWVREEGLGARLSVVPNGVEAGEAIADPHLARRALDLPPQGVVVGLFGQLRPHKGALEFIEAARQAGARDARLHFVLAGDGPRPFLRQVEAGIAAAGLGPRLRLLAPRPSGAELVAASDIVCLATTTPDPFPRAVLEAMAAGRAVVAFESGGTAEMVTRERTGILVPPGDVAGLAAALVRLASDESTRRAMGRAGHERARSAFSLERHVDRMEELLRVA